MKSLGARITAYTTARPVETSTLQVYDRILWMLGEEQTAIEAAIWEPRISVRRFRRLHAQRACLLETIALVQAMKDRHLGNPVVLPTRRIPAPIGPSTGYAEP